VYDKVVEKVLARVAAVQVVDTQKPAPEGGHMGPVISRGQYDKIWAFIDEARAQGLKMVGGERSSVASLGNGYYIPPTVILDAPCDSRVWCEEIFGPVLCMRPFDSEEEGLRVANDSVYGLAGAVFSADAARCERVVRRLRVGTVWVNNCQPAFVQAPWGGVKQSGFGRELGRWGLEEFTAVKQVTSSASGYKWGLW
jgi:betaine-aldehyde dehydrogenase